MAFSVTGCSLCPHALFSQARSHILFPRVAKRKLQKLSFDVLEMTNDKIFEAVTKGKDRAKCMVEELGMAEIFNKHTLWDSKTFIVGIYLFIFVNCLWLISLQGDLFVADLYTGYLFLADLLNSLQGDCSIRIFFSPGWMDCPCLPPPAQRKHVLDN